jgi:hypothetical protein
MSLPSPTMSVASGHDGGPLLLGSFFSNLESRIWSEKACQFPFAPVRFHLISLDRQPTRFGRRERPIVLEIRPPSFPECHPKLLLFWNAASAAVPSTLFFALMFILADAHSTAGRLSNSPSHRSSAFQPNLCRSRFRFSLFTDLSMNLSLVFCQRRPSRPSSGAPLFTWKCGNQ